MVPVHALTEDLVSLPKYMSCISRNNANAFDPYTHGYYKVNGRIGEAFKDGLKFKNEPESGSFADL